MKLVWSMIQCICNVYCCSGEWCGSCAFYSIFLSWHLSAFIFIKKLLFYSNVMTSSNRQRWTHNRVSISTGQWRTLRKAMLLRLWFNGISIWWDATYILFKVRNDNKQMHDIISHSFLKHAIWWQSFSYLSDVSFLLNDDVCIFFA